jgi:predicted permease
MTRLKALPMSFLAVVFPLAAILMAWAATLVRYQRGFFSPVGWLGIAAAGATIYELLAIAWLIVIRRQVDGRFGERMQAKGVDPVGFVGIAGMGILLFPVCVALFLSFVGLQLSHLYTAAAFSAVTTAVWPFMYRRRS